MSSIDDDHAGHAARGIPPECRGALPGATKHASGWEVDEHVLAAFGLQGMVATPAAHPWNAKRTFIVASGAARLALRCWDGPAALQRMLAEEAILRELEPSAFRDYARRVPALNGEMHAWHSKNLAWSAYEFIPGVSPSECSSRAAAMAGELLGRFHRVLSKCPSAAGKTSRLRALPQVAARLRRTRLVNTNQALTEMLCILDAEVVQCVDALLQLPYGGTHGDYVFDNILVDDRARMIDFEFARDDIQLLDFGGLAAPLRRPDGSFVVASRDVLNSAVDAYADNAPNVAATRGETLWRAIAAHWMLVADDLSRVSRRSFQRALAVLATVTSVLKEV
jgi:Ser/Thr protein kinase RdoA (MazF antagonist)